MLGSGHNGCKDVAIDGALEDDWVKPGTENNQLTYELVQVEGDGALRPTSEPEIEVQHLLAEPHDEKVLNIGSMHFNSESIEECLAVEHLSYPIDNYEQEPDYGILCMDAPQIEKQESKYEFVESTLQEDEERNLHLECDISTFCPDYLLDSGFAENFQLNYASYESERLGSECQTQSIGKDNDTGEMSELSNVINPLAEPASDQSTVFLDYMKVHELRDAFRSTFGRDTAVKDKQWLKRRILFGLQNLGGIDNVSGLEESGLSLNKKQDGMIVIPGNDVCERVYDLFTDVSDRKQLMVSNGRGTGKGGEDGNGRGTGKGGENSETLASAKVASFKLGPFTSKGTETAVITSKRLRKRTRRYIEEASEMKSGDKNLHLKTDRQFNQEFSAAAGIQVPIGLQVQRSLKKNPSFMGKDSKVHMLQSVSKRTSFTSQHSDSESEDDVSDEYTPETEDDKSIFRRKHHKSWTLSEVVKLVDGVSQYGVGRWTEIKRALFETSAFRTSVDLKDKWRNLLRASGTLVHNRNQVHSQKAIPLSVLRRVRELSIIHPYPRERKSRLLVTSAKTTVATSDSGTSFGRSGRALQKQSFA